MRISILLSIALIFIALPENLCAQDRFEFIYADSTNKQDSIIDFGATVLGVPVFKTITLKNISDDTLWLEEYTIDWHSTTEDINNPIPFAFREFSEIPENKDTSLSYPIIIPPHTSFIYRIKFTSATTGQSQELGRKTAFHTIKLKKYPTKNIEVAARRFFLTIEKTKNSLVVRRDTVKFDSVYVGATALKDWVVINASTEPVTANQTFSSPTGEFAERDVLKVAEPGPARFIPVQLSYAPVDRGYDTARIKATYDLLQGTESDTISSVITGFGAEQQIDILSAKVENIEQALIDDFKTPDKGDTIDLGNVIVGENRRISLDFKNLGNISFKAVQEDSSLTGAADFSIGRAFSTAPLDIGLTRTVEISLRPRQMGRIVAEYTLESDIASRVEGAPTHARRRSVFITMRGVEAVLSTVGELPFSQLEILDEGCRRLETRNLTITNTGNINLTIESAYLEFGVDFALAKPFDKPETIEPGNTFTLSVNFSPGSLGFKSDRLILTSNNSQPVINIPLKGEAIPQQTLTLSLPPDIRVRPGTMIRVPVVGKGELLKRASYYKAQLDYDTTLLKPNRTQFVITQSTASAGATVNYDKGTKLLKISSATGFTENDTLAFLQFDTFLGNSLFSDISILPQQILFSAPDCPDVSLFKNVTVQNGRVMLDSACGLNVKVGGGSGSFRFLSSIPAPAREKSEIEYEVAFKTAVNITLYDSYGRIVQRAVEAEQTEGIYHVTIPTAYLTPGVYFCEMRAGIYHAVQQIIVAE